MGTKKLLGTYKGFTVEKRTLSSGETEEIRNAIHWYQWRGMIGSSVAGLALGFLAFGLLVVATHFIPPEFVRSFNGVPPAVGTATTLVFGFLILKAIRKLKRDHRLGWVIVLRSHKFDDDQIPEEFLPVSGFTWTTRKGEKAPWRKLVERKRAAAAPTARRPDK